MPIDVTVDLCSPSCPVCAGSGYYRLQVPIGHEAYGKLFMCTNVDRWQLPYSTQIGILKWEAETFNWDQIEDIGGTIEAAQGVKRIIEQGSGWAFLHGSYGIGKTLILKIAVAEALRQGKEAAYVRIAEILDHLRAAYDQEGESEIARLDWWTNLDLLAVDEFDKMRSTPYGKERSFVLMDRRYEQAIREKSITLMASNDPPTKFDGYLYDRIRDGRFRIYELGGESLRPGMEW